MKKILVLLLIVIAGIVLYSFLIKSDKSPLRRDTNVSSSTSEEMPVVFVIAENLNTPWGIAFLPDGSMLVTERAGSVRYIDEKGKLSPDPVAILSSVKEEGEGGLMGIALHPMFSLNNYVYLYYTYSTSGNNTLNRVVRMTFKDKKLSDEKIIIDAIPGALFHNGGRIKFGPDKDLYVATGDAQEPSLAQDTNSLAGKILRSTDDGKPALGNPFNNLVYSYGHRNVQGLAWDSNGQLWATEHGRSGIQSGLDEVNKVEPGKNYGWPVIQGDEKRDGMETAVLNSGATTWAPAGAVFMGDSLFFAGLRGKTLYEATIRGQDIQLKEYFSDEFGRLRDVVIGPDGMLYITTSNLDGRGSPTEQDDRVIRINTAKL